MDKNTIWAFILILAVFWISSELVWKNNVPQTVPEQVQSESAQSAAGSSLTDSLSSAKVAAKESVVSKRDKQPDKLAIADPEQKAITIKEDIILENDKLKVSFTNDGAQINSIVLKDYLMPDKETAVDLVRPDGSLLDMEITDFRGNGVNGAPLVFTWEKPESHRVIFSGQGELGTIRKEFVLRDDYQLDMYLDMVLGLEEYDYIFKFDDGIADTERYLKRKKQNYQLIFEVDNKIERLTLQKLSKNRDLSGSIDWAAVRSKFFVIGMIKDELSSLHKVEAYSNNDTPAFRLYGKSNRSKLNAQYKLYLGPVMSKNMHQVDESFGAAYFAGNGVFFGQGFIKPISTFFSWIFRQFHHVIPNWGLCLILFSILIKGVLYPLTHKSFESSTKMQKIQPEITELREKYKGDPQKMNQEMQRIYKENGVSPLGGCLPMLLQMPIFFALYPVIRYSIDLRQAGFLWLKDLSEPDPYLILPILMAIFMFLQQYMMQPKKEALAKMTEQQQAQMQSQRMMMYVMPAIMFFLFKSFPGGLVLYWTVFNIMSMVQQRIIRRKFS